jgi:hypothetical protein
VDDAAISEDVQPKLHAVLLHTGEETEASFAAFRDSWLTSWRAKTSDAYVGYLWIYAWAGPTASRAEGERAMAARADFPSLPPFLPQTLALTHVGRAYALAGKADEALPVLRKAARACIGLEHPFLHAEAQVELGEALERNEPSDKAGACSAYKAVIDAWGAAKPRSLLAERAKSLASRAGCK